MHASPTSEVWSLRMPGCTVMPKLERPTPKPASHADAAESLRRLRSGSEQHLIVPRMQLRTIGDRSFRVMAARAWNSHPTNVTTATSLASFKRQLKTFLITKSFP